MKPQLPESGLQRQVQEGGVVRGCPQVPHGCLKIGRCQLKCYGWSWETNWLQPTNQKSPNFETFPHPGASVAKRVPSRQQDRSHPWTRGKRPPKGFQAGPSQKARSRHKVLWSHFANPIPPTPHPKSQSGLIATNKAIPLFWVPATTIKDIFGRRA